jgi:hypothetical protein
MFELVHLVFDLLQTSERSEGGFVNSGTGFKMNMLVQQTQLHAARANHVTAIGSLLCSDQTKDGALTRAVTTYETNMLAGVHL